MHSPQETAPDKPRLGGYATNVQSRVRANMDKLLAVIAGIDPDADGWRRVSLLELSDTTGMKLNIVGRAMARLHEQGIIESRRNPANPFDPTKQYRIAEAVDRA